MMKFTYNIRSLFRKLEHLLKQLQSSKSSSELLISTRKYLEQCHPKPTFPYAKEHTVWFEYLGVYYPEPNWKRWLSPFHHKTPQNAFCRGISVNRGLRKPPIFFGMLSRAVKRRLSRGYRVQVLTPNHKFATKVRVKYTKGDPGARSGWSYSMTFEDGQGDWKSCGFVWGKISNLQIWILLQRRPDQLISSTSITFLMQESTSLSRYCLNLMQYEVIDEFTRVKNAWSRFSETVNKYNKKYEKRYGIPLPEYIINDFRANFRKNILAPFRQIIYRKIPLDDWGYNSAFRGFVIHKPEVVACGGKIRRSPKFENWYTETLERFQMIGSDLAIKPWAMSMWMILQEFLNSKFKEIDVENWDVTIGNPTNQDEFFEGNAPEVASFAISGNSGSNDLVAIDPAIETTTYSVFLESIPELPFKLNRWCQVVRPRWDSSMFNRIPLIRNSKFPCQKAYSAFANKMEADAEILQRLELYRHFFEEILAVPIIKCKTSEPEKFAVEVFLPNVVWSGGYRLNSLKGASSIRGATAHCLGQNVLENFNKNGEKATAWVNSWSCSIRAIGLMVMVHGNENSLVLPPKVAPVQVVVTPRLEIHDPGILDACKRVVDMLCEADIRAAAHLDNSVRCWECKGVPLFIKVGPEVFRFKQVEAHRLDNREIINLSMTSEKVKEILDEIQESLFEAAKRRQDACIQIVKNWDEFLEAVHKMRVILAPWCDEEMVEKDVKAELGFISCGYGVKILCSPLEQPEITEGTKCFASGKPAKKWTYWGRNLLDEFSDMWN